VDTRKPIQPSGPASQPDLLSEFFRVCCLRLEELIRWVTKCQIYERAQREGQVRPEILLLRGVAGRCGQVGKAKVDRTRAVVHAIFDVRKLGHELRLAKFAIEALQRVGIAGNNGRSVGFYILGQCCQADRDLVAWLEKQRCTAAKTLAIIDVLVDIGGQYASKEVRRTGADRVYESAIFAIRACRPERDGFAQRNVDDQIALVAQFATVRRFNANPAARRKSGSRGLLRHELQDAAQRACAVNRALRTTQDLDAVQVERIEIARE